MPSADYHFESHPKPAYLHAIATGPRTPDNAGRFLREAFGECMRSGINALLLEMNLDGPPLDPGAIFRVISAGAPDGMKLRRIAYVDAPGASRTGPQFAATVAANRGVNVRLFTDLAAAEGWLLAESGA